MTPQDFLAKWRHVDLKERTAAQSHFNDLCRLVGVDDPVTADPRGQWFTFEKGAAKTGGGEGWADVWRKGCFAWEYKGRAANLDKAFDQLLRYSIALESPPLLIVSDMERIRIHTNWTNTVQQVRQIALEDLADAAQRDLLRACFEDPESLRPKKTRQMLTEEAASEFAALAQRLRARGHEAHTVAHFVIRLVFCMFAEDVQLLPGKMFQRMLQASRAAPAQFAHHARTLFAAMKSGGTVGFEPVEWFNGGLFNDDSVLPLEAADIDNLLAAARLDWSEIDPSILGTLFERGLDPDKRSQLGAHYTDRDKIMMIVRPVIIEPLQREWAGTKTSIEAALTKAEAARGSARTKAQNEAARIMTAWRERLLHFRVLDPACGSGNFLYLSLLALKDIEHRANLEAEQIGLPREFPRVGPECVLGIEINPYAAELARVSVWIGEIQWMRRNGFDAARNPILRKLDNIENRDAVLNDSPQAMSADTPLSLDGRGAGGEGVRLLPQEAQWPQADVAIGNPPFIGGSMMRGGLGDAYVDALRKTYQSRVPGGADFVCYWFEKARSQIEAGNLQAAGLVSTNSIRGGANRKVLDAIVGTTSPVIPRVSFCAERSAVAESMTEVDSATTGANAPSAQNDNGSRKMRIFSAWSDEPWVNNGAAVRVSLTGFGNVGTQHVRLNGKIVTAINADLTAGGENQINLTEAQSLAENAATAFKGAEKNGNFDIDGSLARQWLTSPNPNGCPNSSVVKPWVNGQDIAKRPSDAWVIDFGTDMSEYEASLFEMPFKHALESVKAVREKNNREAYRKYWWRHGEPRPAMRFALKNLSRYLITPRVSKHRFFVWLPVSVLPDSATAVVARDDDTTFGILHSRFHELWSLRLGTSLEDRPRYTPTTTFETFPFPEGMTPRDTQPRHSARSEAQSQNPGDRGFCGFAQNDAALAIAAAARHLNELRENWLNPPEWTDWVITPEEEKAGFPQRPTAKPGHEADLKKRTLTNLYNTRPAWLDMAHKTLDQAVAAAYGWNDYTADMSDEEILRRLLQLNQERAHVH